MDLSFYLSQAANVAASLSGASPGLSAVGRIPQDSFSSRRELRLTFRTEGNENEQGYENVSSAQRQHSMRKAVEEAGLRHKAAEAVEMQLSAAGDPALGFPGSGLWRCPKPRREELHKGYGALAVSSLRCSRCEFAPGESCQNSMLHVLFLAVGDVAGNRNHHATEEVAETHVTRLPGFDFVNQGQKSTTFRKTCTNYTTAMLEQKASLDPTSVMASVADATEGPGAEDDARPRRLLRLGQISRQLEFYFSDSNLARDSILREVLTDGRGGVELAWLLESPKLRAWGTTPAELKEAVQMSSKLELLEAEASDTDNLARVRRKIADPEDLPEVVEDPGRVGGTVLIVTCRMKSSLKTPSAGVRLDSDTDKSEGTRSDAESEDQASAGGDGDETGPRGAVRRAVRDLGAPRGAVLGASEPNSFGEVVVAIAPFSGDDVLQVPRELAPGRARPVFGAQRAKALQLLPNRVRRELSSIPATKHRRKRAVTSLTVFQCFNDLRLKAPPAPSRVEDMRLVLAALMCMSLLGMAASAPGARASRRLCEDEEVAYVPLTAKKEYPLDAGMMVLGAFTGALGVPLLFLIWAVLERRKPEGGAFGKLLGASE
eukprot:s998_g8.t1